jgi:hypothetical protein
MKYLYLIFIIIVIAFAAASIGLFEIPDAFFYYTLGQYLYTGEIFSILPFNTKTPQTLFSPVYGLLVYPLVSRQPISPLFVIPLMQLSMIAVSALLLSRILKKLFPQINPAMGIVVFLLLPFNIIYAFMFMSETTTMFIVSIYLSIYLLLASSAWRNSLLVLTASILVLTRYAFIPLFGLSLLFFFIRRPKQVYAHIPAAIGVCCVAAWILFHVHWYHSPKLSAFTGRHIYNNVITAGKFIPKDHANAQVAQFFTFVPFGEMVKPWWDIQPYFASAFYEGKVTELEVDDMFLAVSIQGIKEHILPYILHLMKMAIITPNTPPYHDNVLSQIGFEEPSCSICTPKNCRFHWIPAHCRPILSVPFATTLFGFFILGNKAFYPLLSSVFMILAGAGILGSFLSKNKYLIGISIFFLIQHMFQSATEWVEGRFLLPLYPLYTILIVQGFITLIKLISSYPRRRVLNS